MSRFFAGSSSESETSSSEEELYSSSESGSEESSSEEDSENESDSDSDSGSDDDGERKTGANKFLKKSFMKGAPSDSESESEDESKRVVKSAKDKLIDEIDLSIKAIDNGKKINDWVAISAEFDKLNKHAERAIKQYQTTPFQYIKSISELEDFMNESIKTEKASKKKMNALNARALNTAKQRIKKNNKSYESYIAKFKEDPTAFQKSLEPKDATAPTPKVSKLKVTDVIADTPADINEGFSTVGKAGRVAQYTTENIFTTIQSITESRGKKNTDRKDQVRILSSLFDVAETPYQKIIVLLRLIPVRFDTMSSGQSISVENWKVVLADITSLFDILEVNVSRFQINESAPEPESLEVGLPPRADGVVEINGSIASLVERLDDEFTRSLQDIDFHTTEYVDRLRDENSLYTLILRTQIYLETLATGPISEVPTISRILLRRLEHIYFKPSAVIIAAEEVAWSSLTSSTLNSSITPRPKTQNKLPTDYTITLINSICAPLYRQTNPIYRTRAILSNIFHYALNNQYYKARDLLLMSHLQSTIHTAEPPIQILFNRALAQIGVCAFRSGLIDECQQTLQELNSSARLKELLGQGGQKNSQSTTEGRQRLLPFHMHINLELLECVYLTASLLLEIPSLASTENQIDTRRKVVSKTFRRMLDNSRRQVFTGPPENTRDHIMQAAKALLDSEWVTARDLLNSIKIWSLLPDAESIKKMLGEHLQVTGLRTYLFRYGSTYQSLNLVPLASLFGLSEGRVVAIVCQMIANEEIAAALDQTAQVVVFRQGVELSRLQNLALALSEKAVHLVERNERLAAGGHQLNDTNRGNANVGNAANKDSTAGNISHANRTGGARFDNRRTQQNQNSTPKPIKA